MRKFFLILAISVAIAVLYGADTRAAPGNSGGGNVIAVGVIAIGPDPAERARGLPRT